MGHEIPEPFVWDESFKVFVSMVQHGLMLKNFWKSFSVIFQYDHLDSQHRGLFQAIFDVGKSPSDTHSLSTLVNLMQEHFDHEEVSEMFCRNCLFCKRV